MSILEELEQKNKMYSESLSKQKKPSVEEGTFLQLVGLWGLRLW